ncbi:MAG: alkaline phosphatase family protein [Eubacteriales bacterium]|nr:alkaline phosphatase family protein [Eubacteriales bacterium]
MAKNIVGLMNSFLKYFNVPVLNQSFDFVDNIIAGAQKNIVLILLDGMGSLNMQDCLKENSFFKRNKICDYNSVFPPTTVAATASYDTGLYPSQHARLGWTMYYPEIDQNVEVYSNKNEFKEQAAAFNAAEHFTPYKSVHEYIREKGFDSYVLSPYQEPSFNSFDDILSEILRLTECGGTKYIYAYWGEPDSLMHKKGVRHKDVIDNMRQLEQKVEAFAARLKNTFCFVSADHGHIDADGRVLCSYPDIAENLLRLPTIEQRAMNLFAKPQNKDQLKKAFERHFEDKYTLYSREEVLDTKLFGEKPYHPSLESFLGDFIAVANTPLTLFNSIDQLNALKGVHGGGTEKEKTIPLILL